jgi:outer membrane protein assembly factor BamD
MTYPRSIIFILLFSAGLLAGCSSYQKVLRSNDITLKYKVAEELYNKADYQRALPLLEDIYKFYIGTAQAEKVSYMLAFCYYKMGEYQLGAYQFKNFAEGYPLSTYAEDASYYYAYCLFLDSPQKDLDQSSTVSAINAFQLFMDKYPNNKHVEECNKNIDILENKLEVKAVDNALLYYKIENYKAAVWAIRNVLQQYPSNKDREKLEYIMVKSSYLYAANSIEEKKLERYSSTLEYYNEFKEKYPVSKYDNELKTIVKDSNYHVQQLKMKNKNYEQ